MSSLKTRAAWPTVSLVDCLSEKPTYGANSAALEYDPNLPRYVRITDILDDGRLSSDDPKSLGRDAARGNMLEPGDITIARSGASVGKSYLHRDGCNFAYAGYLIRFRPDCSMVLPDYVHAVIQSNLFRRWLNGMRREGAQPNVNAKEYGSFRFPLPPLSEQRKIAAILRTWDEALSNLRALRAAQQCQIRVLSQTLLTGKRRIPGFRGRSWRTAHLSDLGDLIRGRGITRTDLVVGHGIPCLRYGDIYTTYANSTANLRSFVSSDDASKGTPLCHGDIVFAASGETLEEIGQAVAWLGTDRAVAGGDTVILRGHGQNAEFLGHVLNAEEVLRQKARLGKGNAVVHVHARDLARVEVRLPGLSEQRRITEILSTWSAAEKSYGALQERTLRQRRGLMQALIDG